MTLVHNILGAHLFMCSILILIVGIALIYGLLACCACDIIKLSFMKKSKNITCILCKEEVTQESWEGHRSDCARENEWFIETLPKSEVILTNMSRIVTLLEHCNFVRLVNARICSYQAQIIHLIMEINMTISTPSTGSPMQQFKHCKSNSAPEVVAIGPWRLVHLLRTRLPSGKPLQN